MLVLKLPAPFDAVAGRQRHVARHGFARFIYEADQIAPAHAGLDQREARAVLAPHQHGAISGGDARQRGQGDFALIATGELQVLEPLGRSAQPGIPAHHDGRAPVRLDHQPGRHAFELRTQLVLNLRHGQSGATGRLRIHLHLQVFHAVAGLGEHVARTGHFLDASGHALRQIAQRLQIRAEQLDGHVAPAAGEHFRDAHLDGLGKAEFQAGEGIHHLAYLGTQRVLVGCMPILARCELHEQVGFVQAHRVEPQLVGAHPPDAVPHLGHRRTDGLLHCQVNLQRALQPDGRRLLQLQQDIALVHRRHERLARAEVGHHTQCQGRDGDRRCA